MTFEGDMKNAICILVTVLCCAGISPAQSATAEIEAEDYTDCLDIAFELIRADDAPSCTGGKMLVGLDFPDEWTEYTLNVSTFGDFKVSMKSRGDIAVDYTLCLTLTGNASGQSQTIDLTYNGNGYG
jgi:hypothetical protein